MDRSQFQKQPSQECNTDLQIKIPTPSRRGLVFEKNLEPRTEGITKDCDTEPRDENCETAAGQLKQGTAQGEEKGERRLLAAAWSGDGKGRSHVLRDGNLLRQVRHSSSGQVAARSWSPGLGWGGEGRSRPPQPRPGRLGLAGLASPALPRQE